jgi:exopolysaccharide biosynthesis protein
MKRINETKKRINKKILIAFIVFEFVFSALVAPIIVYYGPFETLKKNVVGTFMSTMNHQYLAKLFVTNKRIDKILGNNLVPVETEITQDLTGIKISHDSTIECNKISSSKFDGYMIVVHNPLRVKLGVASTLGEQGQKTSQIAKGYNAIAAINGGGFTDRAKNSALNWTGTGAFPTGIVIIDGKIAYPKDEIDLNNSIDDIAGITYDGYLIVGRYSINQLIKKRIRDALTFGPVLISNGVANPYVNNQGANPRTAIGQRNDGAILMLVIDGRRALQLGASLADVQNIMLQQGAVTAINLDGGASATMYYEGKVINTPSDTFGERPIPTIFYVK